ncbi:MAG TPA: large conductance mechanosensitive channel protein MscL [Clostridiales bacterium]|nr:large conductance mechanosensitive channel protein MscL [Clostridiales bacterium]
MKKFTKEFKEFALKGNVIDLAVGVIIGAAFQSIVKSLVDDIIMPVISLITGGIDFSNWFISLDGSTYATLAGAKEAGASVLAYGNFISAVINFLIMALVIFIFVKLINKAKTIGKKDEKPAPTTKKCPYCLSEIPIKATKCPHCTSIIEIKEKKEDKE